MGTLSSLLLSDKTLLDSILQYIPSLLFVTDAEGVVRAANERAVSVLGRELAELEGYPLEKLCVEADSAAFRGLLSSVVPGGEPVTAELSVIRGDGEAVCCSFSASVVDSTPLMVLFFAEDITISQLVSEQLFQSQKLGAVGQLLAGVAHEINTPVQYIGTNTEFVKSSLEDLAQLHEVWEKLVDASVDRPELEELLREVNTRKDQVDLDYLQEELPKCLSQTLEGVGTVSRLVHSLKAFSHPGSPDKELHDLRGIIEHTLTVTKNEWKYVATLDVDYDESVGSVPCYGGEINQVVANLIINAAHAIGEQREAEEIEELGAIHICVGTEGEYATITITDNGPGIPDTVRPQIFDRFFTTKQVGKGTGQGLAIARTIVVDRHQGTIDLDSQPGRTSFTVRLPLTEATAKMGEA